MENNIKKLLAVFLMLSLAFSAVGCRGGQGNGGGILGGSKKIDPTDPSIYTIDVVSEMQLGKALGMLDSRESTPEIEKASEDLLDKIEACPDTVKAQAGGKTYYVSNKGDDSNDGLSPEKPFATILKATLKTQSGDAVLLERGSFWRETIIGRKGVSYGAYGKGNKPTLYGSIDGLALEWEQDEDNENIWIADVGVISDIGLIIFNHGKAFANPKLKKEQLIQDYNFYYETRGKKVYLYYSKGNPTEDFYSFELCPDVNIIKPESNCKIQNIRMMYTGGCGVMYSYKDNITVQGCIVGYIGGSIMGSSVDIRYGNAITLWGAGDGMYVDRCHIYQVFDAGVSFQWTGSGEPLDITEQNIAYTNNLIEYCVYNFEYFLTNSTGALRNIDISNNIMRYAGYGWGRLARPSKNTATQVAGTELPPTEVENFVIKNNIFDLAIPTLIRLIVDDDSRLPVFSGNTYVVKKDYTLYENERQKIKFNAKDCIGKTAEEIFGDKTGKIIIQ